MGYLTAVAQRRLLATCFCPIETVEKLTRRTAAQQNLADHQRRSIQRQCDGIKSVI